MKPPSSGPTPVPWTCFWAAARVSGRPVRWPGDGKTLWSRAYTRGKTINRLDLFTLPETTHFVWTPQTGYQADVISLDEQFPADPEIQKLF